MIYLARATLILLAAQAVVFGLRRSSAAMRHAVWTSALVSLLLLPLVPPLTLPAPAPPLLASIETTASQAVEGTRDVWTVIWLTGTALLLLRLTVAHIHARKATGDVSPMVIGLWNPRIVLPASSSGWSPELRRLVLTHEMAHIARRDNLWSLLAHLARAAYWFHPLVWLAVREMTRESERACDDAVLRTGANGADYASALVGVARTTLSAPAAAAAMTGASPLESRVHAILDPRINRTPARLTPVIFLFLFALLPLAAFQTGKVYSVQEDGVTRPKLVRKVEPAYTEAARDAKVSGRVKLALIVTEAGEADQVTVLEGLHPDLDANAMSAVRQWKFSPGRKGDTPVKVRATVEVNFKLK